MDRDELLRLAERCEAASGADDNAGRALGREVLIACGRGYVSPLYAWQNPILSIDAALTLVPKGWLVCVEGPFPTGWEATVRQPYDDGNEVQANTAPLALTAAVLHAQAAEKPL